MHGTHPAALDVLSDLEVAEVLHLQAGQQEAVFGDGRHRRRQLADALRS